MSSFIVAMTNQVERNKRVPLMNNKTNVKLNWRCFKKRSMIGRLESVRIQ